jgi:hypothetical protein
VADRAHWETCSCCQALPDCMAVCRTCDKPGPTGPLALPFNMASRDIAGACNAKQCDFIENYKGDLVCISARPAGQQPVLATAPALEPHQGTGYQLARAAPLLNRGRPSVLWGVSRFPTWLALLQGDKQSRRAALPCHQCVVRVRERSAAKAGSARALRM